MVLVNAETGIIENAVGVNAFIRDVGTFSHFHKEMQGQILRAAQHNLLTSSCTEKELGHWV